MSDLERLFATRTRFDPATATREFVIHTTDYGVVMLGRAIAEELAASAPGVTLRFRPLTDADLREPHDVLRLADGFIVPHGVLDDLPCVDAYRVVECPFEPVRITEALWWHPTLELDPSHRWFRAVVERAGRRVAASTAGAARTSGRD